MSALLIGVTAQCAMAESFSIGQRVSFDDRLGRYGGGRVSGTIIKDKGPSWEYAQRYRVKVDGAEGDLQTADFDGSALQGDVGNAHPALRGEEARAGINHDNAKFRAGDKVTFEDRLGRFGGGRISATVVRDKGPSWEYAQRYEVRVDGVDAALQNQAFNADELQGSAALADGYDWTASVYDHMIQFKSELGLAKQGNRY